MLPTALPTLLGANFVVKLVLWPAASVIGAESPAMLNPVPLALIAEIVTPVLPAFVKLIVC